MQTSMVFSQRAWPGAGDLDDCWAVSGIQAANVTAPHLPLYGIPRFRREAGNPDDPNVADGGTITQIVRGLRGCYPSIAPDVQAHRGASWQAFTATLAAGRPVSVAIDSSQLAVPLRFGFTGRHQVTLVQRSSVLLYANPLAAPYSRWLRIEPADIRGAVMRFGRLVNGVNGAWGAWFVSLPTEAEVQASEAPADETPFDQDDIDAATAALQARIDAAREALDGVTP